MTWINEIVSAITTPFTTLITSVLGALKDGFVTLFFDKSTEGAITGISDFCIFSFVLMGISLALGLTYYITNLVRRKM